VKKFVLLLAGIVVATVVCFFLHDNGEVDLFATSSTQTVIVGKHEVALITSCNWDDCLPRVGVCSQNTPLVQVWEGRVNGQGENSVNGQSFIRASTDGVILAMVKSDSASTSRRPLPGVFFQWNNLSTGTSAKGDTIEFSRQARRLLEQHGGVTTPQFLRREVGKWVWQDRIYKNFMAR